MIKYAMDDPEYDIPSYDSLKYIEINRRFSIIKNNWKISQKIITQILNKYITDILND